MPVNPNTQRAQSGEAPGADVLQTNTRKAPGLWRRIERFERADWEILDLAFNLAGASPEVRAAIQTRCRKAKAQYEPAPEARLQSEGADA